MQASVLQEFLGNSNRASLAPACRASDKSLRNSSLSKMVPAGLLWRGRHHESQELDTLRQSDAGERQCGCGPPCSNRHMSTAGAGDC